MDITSRDIDSSFAGPGTLERLVRTLLHTLGSVSHFESVYLTRVDEAAQTQEILFADNTRRERLEVHEGVVVPWRDSLCRIALQQDSVVLEDVDRLWDAFPGMKRLGIRTYLSEPVRDARGGLLGTLCAVSDRRVPITAETLHTLARFARLIAHQFCRERVLARIAEDSRTLGWHETVDLLTGVANRRGLVAGLAQALAVAPCDGSRAFAVFVDLDHCRAVNESHGPDAGDHFLLAVAGRLAATVRAGELLGRYGGDEFLVVGRGAVDGDDAERLGERLAAATRGRYELGETVFDYPGASVGVVRGLPDEDAEALLRRADRTLTAARLAGTGNGNGVAANADAG